ncbi:MAG: ABC transporter permease, partial [Bacteroidales bacterium]|nr:ABC transporter permease [Bacteroidales bacterium]
MFDIDKYKEIWQTISRNKMRSFLTGFGVSWGIFLFVVMFGAGTGMQKGLTDTLGENISNSFFMRAGRTTMPYKGFNANRLWNISNADLSLIMQTIPEVKYLSGMLYNNAGKVAHSDKSGSYTFMGVNPDYFKIEIIPLAGGRTFNRIDMDEKRKVCVIGKRVREELFEADENPVGQQLLINGIAYYVAGILESSETSFIGRPDLSVFIPLTTMQQILNAGDVIHMFMGVFAPNIDIALVEKKVQTLLKKQHSIAPEDNDAMVSLNLHDYFMMF